MDSETFKLRSLMLVCGEVSINRCETASALGDSCHGWGQSHKALQLGITDSVLALHMHVVTPACHACTRHLDAMCPAEQAAAVVMPFL